MSIVYATHPTTITKMSTDWFKRKSTGNHVFYDEIWGCPVKCPLNPLSCPKNACTGTKNFEDGFKPCISGPSRIWCFQTGSPSMSCPETFLTGSPSQLRISVIEFIPIFETPSTRKWHSNYRSSSQVSTGFPYPSTFVLHHGNFAAHWWSSPWKIHLEMTLACSACSANVWS